MLRDSSDQQLTDEHIREFQKQGYLVLPNFYNEDKVHELQNEANRLLELGINSLIFTNRDRGRLTITEDEDGHQSIRTMTPYIDISRVLKDVATTDLASLLEPLFNEKPISINNLTQLNYKQPLPEPIEQIETTEGDDRFPIHADWPYFKGWAPEGIVTSILFIDDCTEAKGPLEIWPGTHKQDIDHEESDEDLEVRPENVDHNESEMICGPAGSVLLMNSKVVHSSGPNTTDEPRRLAVYRHASKDNVDAIIKDGSARPNRGEYPTELIETTYEHEFLRLRQQGEISDEEIYRV